MTLKILHTNDFHGRMDAAKAGFIRGLKDGRTLYFDTGDCIKTGNLGIPLQREKVWDLLAVAGCDASVLGNRESHVLASAFRAKIDGHSHPILCANLRAKDGGRPLAEKMILEVDGQRVGVFGVMVAMVTERMASKAASAYLWDPPILTAKRVANELRGEVDCLIALTHIGYKADRELAEACGSIDLILGGHSHTVLNEPVKVGRTWMAQGGSHGKFVGSYEWDGQTLTGSLVTLP